ncbi:MAG TPA: hypothetical protein VGK32_23310 [Vicinamibacterales bacterium]|jgi:hypothetical protein
MRSRSIDAIALLALAVLMVGAVASAEPQSAGDSWPLPASDVLEMTFASLDRASPWTPLWFRTGTRFAAMTSDARTTGVDGASDLGCAFQPQPWIVVELNLEMTTGEEWGGGADLTFSIVDQQHNRLSRTTDVFVARWKPAAFVAFATPTLKAGAYRVEIQGRARKGGRIEVPPVPVTMPECADAQALGFGTAVLWRAPSTKSGPTPTANAQYRAGTVVRVEVTMGSQFEHVAERLLLRGAAAPVEHAMSRPVPAPRGTHIVELDTKDLRPGDYAIEFMSQQQGTRYITLVAFRLLAK